jgi:hypothetical protein
MTKLVEKEPIHIVVEEADIRPPPLYHEEAPPKSDTERHGLGGHFVVYVLFGALVVLWLVLVAVARFV